MPNNANLAQNAPAENNVDLDWSQMQSHLTTAVAASLGSAEALTGDPDALRSAIDTVVVDGLRFALQNVPDRWADGVLGAERYAGFNTHAQGSGRAIAAARGSTPSTSRSGRSRSESQCRSRAEVPRAPTGFRCSSEFRTA